jgi:hypothetical protein
LFEKSFREYPEAMISPFWASPSIRDSNSQEAIIRKGFAKNPNLFSKYIISFLSEVTG